ncbi:hypothetical protein [Pandoraea apista]|uniref:Uncharacterized protein n=1 Tax=Pandoraea apista TaxID=93218 RepID=A0ABX9ZHY3_9BURK|nr:hypothetical protein [Pandoraea apista]AJE99249.1 hypothetical protein SG18_15525 [Pandoraea apista]AKH73358.1 hypothetical protein XM39_15720 [Pandoraea apista]AKI61904.1 hypothetical protein AA956_09030 [Pandoraea apista]RRJ25356.1 hypothetical protein EIB05_24170 [Pandoraea apista]RRJ72346.1 hypothetical protein EIL82_24115 [Pandoraea apista]
MAIVSVTSRATSSMLDVWQAHIQQQQANKAQASAGSTPSSNAPAGTSAVVPGSTAKSTATANSDGAGASAGGNGSVSLNIDTQRVADLRDVSETAKRAGRAITGNAGSSGSADSADGASGAGGVSPIVSQTIEKLKQMLAKVMAQLEAVRNNNALPPEEKLQQTTVLSSEAMSIQAQIQALMDPTKATGTRVNTTA